MNPATWDAGERRAFAIGVWSNLAAGMVAGLVAFVILRGRR